MTAPALVRVDPADFAAHRPAIAALDASVRATRGHPALGDAVWRDLDHPGRDSAGFLVGEQAYAHVARVDSAATTRWTAGVVTAPSAGDEALTALLGALGDHVGAHGGGLVDCWAFGAPDDDDGRFVAAGFVRTRELYEMRVPLPIAEEPRWPVGIRVRDYDAARDADAWLAVNNRAFAGHPEQGGWLGQTLRTREGEPWFDPRLFLLAFDDDGLAGFDWLKLHAPRAPDPLLGEIYVIGVDPRAQGTGLGRALALSGLARAHAHGARTGMLFCAADNAGALSLYRSLGFTVHRADRAYEREIAPA